jgi:CysZ protein
LVVVTGLFTWLSYLETVQFISGLTGDFFQTAPAVSGSWGWLLDAGWLVFKYLFLFITRIIAFYLAFLVSYCLTSPGYIFLSSAVEKIYLNRQRNGNMRIANIIVDLWEGIKIGLLGILVTFIALALNFIPVVGQIMAFLIYVFYSALMFIDYPASSRNWTLAHKINWIRTYYRRSWRIGILPALISMVPFINIPLMAIFFPLFTVHTTLNFIVVQNETDNAKFAGY